MFKKYCMYCRAMSAVFAFIGKSGAVELGDSFVFFPVVSVKAVFCSGYTLSCGIKILLP